MDEILLTCADLSVWVRKGSQVKQLLHGINLSVLRNQTVGITGESGSGKTMLIHGLLRLLPDNFTFAGEVLYYSGQGPAFSVVQLEPDALRKFRRESVGILFQNPAASLNPLLKCGSQISEALPETISGNKESSWREVTNLLSLLGFDDSSEIANSYPHELSGGMAQRVALAVALAGWPNLLVIDEPTAALDLITARETLNLLKEIQRQYALSIIIISHDLDIMTDWCDSLVLLSDGRVIEQGSTATIINNPGQDYTKNYLADNALL